MLDVNCGGGYSVDVPSCSGSSQWIIGYVDNGSGFGEEDDNNTGEVEERDGEEVFSVRVQQRLNHDAWMKRMFFLHTKNLLSHCTQVICAV